VVRPWQGRRGQPREHTRKSTKARSEVDNQSMEEGSPTYPRGRSVSRTHQGTPRQEGFGTRGKAYIAPRVTQLRVRYYMGST
jgi:hypothetical protein